MLGAARRRDRLRPGELHGGAGLHRSVSRLRAGVRAWQTPADVDVPAPAARRYTELRLPRWSCSTQPWPSRRRPGGRRNRCRRRPPAQPHVADASPIPTTSRRSARLSREAVADSPRPASRLLRSRPDSEQVDRSGEAGAQPRGVQGSSQCSSCAARPQSYARGARRPRPAGAGRHGRRQVVTATARPRATRLALPPRGTGVPLDGTAPRTRSAPRSSTTSQRGCGWPESAPGPDQVPGSAAPSATSWPRSPRPRTTKASNPLSPPRTRSTGHSPCRPRSIVKPGRPRRRRDGERGSRRDGLAAADGDTGPISVADSRVLRFLRSRSRSNFHEDDGLESTRIPGRGCSTAARPGRPKGHEL